MIWDIQHGNVPAAKLVELQRHVPRQEVAHPELLHQHSVEVHIAQHQEQLEAVLEARRSQGKVWAFNK